MTPEERSFLERARVGTLATADGEGNPHAVPICFALVEAAGGPRLVTAIDEKPKSTRDLRRVRDVRANPAVAVTVDRYREDWSRLAWVQVRGRARVLSPGSPGHDRAVGALRTTYDQYADHALEERPALEIRVDRTVSWGALDPSENVPDHEYDERGT